MLKVNRGAKNQSNCKIRYRALFEIIDYVTSGKRIHVELIFNLIRLNF